MSLYGVNRAKFPLIVYGTAEDLTTWTDVSTPVTTGSQADPFGGTGAAKIQDDNAAALEYKKKTVVFTEDGAHVIGIVWKESTPAPSDGKSRFQIRDSTAGSTRARGVITWSTGAISSIVGTLIANIALGDGWYLTIIEATGIVAANTNEVHLQPTGSTVAQTGTVLFYVRPVLLFGEHLDKAQTFSEPRIGSQFVQARSGVEDAWVGGRDQRLDGTVRWIPATPTATPRPASGWNGAGELAGVNNGWDDFLAQAQDKQTFLWVPDRTAPSLNVSSYLVEPLQGKPGLESDFTRNLELKIRSSDGSRYLGY